MGAPATPDMADATTFSFAPRLCSYITDLTVNLMMLSCPVCQHAEDWDEGALNSHVNSHFEDDAPSVAITGRSSLTSTTSAGPFQSTQAVATDETQPRGSKRNTPEEETVAPAKRSRTDGVSSESSREGRECFICGLSFEELPAGQTVDAHVNICLGASIFAPSFG